MCFSHLFVNMSSSHRLHSPWPQHCCYVVCLAGFIFLKCFLYPYPCQISLSASCVPLCLQEKDRVNDASEGDGCDVRGSPGSGRRSVSPPAMVGDVKGRGKWSRRSGHHGFHDLGLMSLEWKVCVQKKKKAQWFLLPVLFGTLGRDALREPSSKRRVLLAPRGVS